MSLILSTAHIINSIGFYCPFACIYERLVDSNPLSVYTDSNDNGPQHYVGLFMYHGLFGWLYLLLFNKKQHCQCAISTTVVLEHYVSLQIC